MNWLPPQRMNWPLPPEKKKRGRAVENGREWAARGKIQKKHRMANKWDPYEYGMS
jgi:hypothetical protein